MNRLAAITTALSLALCTRTAAAAECTHDIAMRGIAVLNSVSIPEPSWVYPTGQYAGAPYLYTLTLPQLDATERNVTAVQHWVGALHLALAGQCGGPLNDHDRGEAARLSGQYETWITAWQEALPFERARRTSDKGEALEICTAEDGLADARNRVALEKANPSGVVDLAELHTQGQRVQFLTLALTSRKALFVRDRGKPFARRYCQ